MYGLGRGDLGATDITSFGDNSDDSQEPGDRGHKVAADTTGTGSSARTSPYRTRPTEPVQFATVQFLGKLLDAWKLGSSDAIVLLGMDPDDRSCAEDILNGRAILKGRDARDRIAYLYRIRKILSALFRDEEVENQWLREPHAMLNERSPMDLMLDGSMEDLLLVREYVEAAAGR